MKITESELKNIILEEFNRVVEENSIDEGFMDRLKRGFGAAKDAFAKTPEELSSEAAQNAADVALDAVKDFASAFANDRKKMVKRLGSLDLDQLVELSPELSSSIKRVLSWSKGGNTRLANLVDALELIQDPKLAADIAASQDTTPGLGAGRRPRGRGVSGGDAIKRGGTATTRGLGAMAENIDSDLKITKEGLMAMIKDELENSKQD
tara:strand:- start:2773 stop:3396 length:624 start_codon:yes stop_codon:yes gene_type:complete